jgi:hypothetical protein
MTRRNEPRRTSDVLLLSIWVFGYSVLIRTFSTLQRLERFFAGSSRDAANNNILSGPGGHEKTPAFKDSLTS